MGETEATVAVVAHALLQKMNVVTNGLGAALGRWGEIGDEERRRLLERALDSAELVSEALRDLIRGLPESARARLDDLAPRPALEAISSEGSSGSN